MSERRKRGQAEQFKHLRDSALDESFKREHLFTHKKEIFIQQFRCSLAGLPNSLPLNKDAPVLLLVRDTTIDVIYNNVIVGHISSGCESIRDAIASDPRACNMINATICSQPGLSRSFYIQINE